MNDIASPQIDLVHGAGSVEAAVMRWYLYTLSNPGGPMPYLPDGTRY